MPPHTRIDPYYSLAVLEPAEEGLCAGRLASLGRYQFRSGKASGPQLDPPRSGDIMPAKRVNLVGVADSSWVNSAGAEWSSDFNVQVVPESEPKEASQNRRQGKKSECCKSHQEDSGSYQAMEEVPGGPANGSVCCGLSPES